MIGVCVCVRVVASLYSMITSSRTALQTNTHDLQHKSDMQEMVELEIQRREAG